MTIRWRSRGQAPVRPNRLGQPLRLVATDDSDTVWGEVIDWPRHRLTAALVAAVGVIQSNDPDDMAAGQDTEWTPPDGR